MDKMNRIVINATFSLEKPTGLGVYTYELVRELLKLESRFDFTVYTSSRNLKNLYPERVTLAPSFTSPGMGFWGHLLRLVWQQSVLPFKVRKERPSLFYSTVPEGLLGLRQKQIITVHDLLPVKYPASCPKMSYYFHYSLPTLLNNSKAIICVSENTKKDLMARHPVEGKPVYVIYEGFDRTRFYPREKGGVRKWFGFTDYLLYVGDMRPYKNLENNLAAFARLNLRGYKFVIGGKKDPRFYPKVEKKARDLGIRDRVIFLDYVSQEHLPHLYSEAAAFVFPSLYEGFGLPPLEAMACGCPVVVSHAASLPEVCGDGAYYVDPYDVESIAEGVHRVLKDELLRSTLIGKGFERTKLFSWEKAAKEHLKVFEEILSL